MGSKIFKYGHWICPKLFADEIPLNVFHKENEKLEIELPDRLKNLHMLTRRTIALDTVPESAVIRISADDYYKLYVNGRFVCQGPAQGYYFAYNYNEIDLTAFLCEGENEILIDVYYQGLINRAYNSGDRRMGVIAEILTDKECLVATGQEWEYCMSEAYTVTHTVGYDTMFAENFDSRFTPREWHRCHVKDFGHIFNAAPAKLLSVYDVEPTKVQTLYGGCLLCDFGGEITAGMKISARGRAGAQVRILCGEELEESAVKVRYIMRCNSHCEEIWTLTDGISRLEQYDYRAFRYVAIIPDPDVEILEIKATVRHYPFDDGYCTLKSDSELLIDIFNMCKRGIKYGAQEVFVDCPMREKGQYAGDLTVSSSSHLILTHDTSLLKKAIDNQMESAAICPGLMAVTPGSFMQEFTDYSLQFPLLALKYYSYTKDDKYLKKCLSACENLLAYFRRFESDSGLLCDFFDKPTLVDWPTNLRDGYDFDLASREAKGIPHNVINAFYIGCIKSTEEIRDILGVPNERRSEKLSEVFRQTFYREELGLYADSASSMHTSLHANAIVAFYGINRPSEVEDISEHIMSRGLCCGVYMAYFVLKGLCRMGKHREAYELIVNKSEHSWYNMLKEGATTCFEAWGKEQKWNTSLCHPWASAPISVLAEDILPNLPHLGTIVYSSEKNR